MSSDLALCKVDPELKRKVEKFRFQKSKTASAIVATIDPEKLLVIEDSSISEELEDYENPTIDEVASLIPAHLPRYIIYSFPLNHADGRISYPLCFIFYSPRGSKPEFQMMFAGSKTEFINALKFTKVYEVRDIEDITQEWLTSKLTGV